MRRVSWSATDKLKDRLRGKPAETTVYDEAEGVTAEQVERADPKPQRGRKKAAKKKPQQRDPEDGTHPKTDSGMEPEFSLEEWHQLLGECTTTQAMTDVAAVLDKAHDDQLISREEYNEGLMAMHAQSEDNAGGKKK